MKLDISLDAGDLGRIKGKLKTLDSLLRSSDGPILRYLVKYVADPYANAVLSGMGTVEVGTIWEDKDTYLTHSLAPFLGSAASVRWRTLSPYTKRDKADRGLTLAVWMATGETAQHVKSVLKVTNKSFILSSGISKSAGEAYKRAVAVEFGGISSDLGVAYEKRALFTTLNEIFVANIETIRAGVRQAIVDSIEKSGWGS